MSYLFDIDKAAKEASLSEEMYNQIKKEVHKEFPYSEMMYELHVLRAIKHEITKNMTPEEHLQYIHKRAEEAMSEFRSLSHTKKS